MKCLTLINLLFILLACGPGTKSEESNSSADSATMAVVETVQQPEVNGESLPDLADLVTKTRYNIDLLYEMVGEQNVTPLADGSGYAVFQGTDMELTMQWIRGYQIATVKKTRTGARHQTGYKPWNDGWNTVMGTPLKDVTISNEFQLTTLASSSAMYTAEASFTLPPSMNLDQGRIVFTFGYPARPGTEGKTLMNTDPLAADLGLKVIAITLSIVNPRMPGSLKQQVAAAEGEDNTDVEEDPQAALEQSSPALTFEQEVNVCSGTYNSSNGCSYYFTCGKFINPKLDLDQEHGLSLWYDLTKFESQGRRYEITYSKTKGSECGGGSSIDVARIVNFKLADQ